MRKFNITYTALVGLIAWLTAAYCQPITAQSDTTIHRTVTVEREFQPVIQSAGKINQRPAIITPEIQLNPVVYSTYSTPLSIDYNINQLPAAKTNFTAQSPLNGTFEAALGHRNTHLLFGYQIHQKKKMSLSLYANHDAYWGKPDLVKDAQSCSKIGLDYTYHFSNCDLYTNIEGKLSHWDYYIPTLHENYGKVCIESGSNLLWDAQANVGVKSTGNKNFQYRIQSGYTIMGEGYHFEHSVNTHIDLKWTNNTHTAGINTLAKNNFYNEYAYVADSDDDFLHFIHIPHNRHALRIEPFYEYAANNFHLHAGVNLDMNIDSFINTNQHLSQIENLAFAPSPNIQLSWHTANNIFHLYAKAVGSFGTAMRDEQLRYNCFNLLSGKEATQHIAPYTPVDATIGFKLRPIKTLLLDFYGGYAWMGQYTTYVNIYQLAPVMNATSIDYQISEQTYQQWKVGGSLHYHYRDIIEFNVAGNYYFFRNAKPNTTEPTHTIAYDRPDWDLKARVEAHIDSKWSLYSDNYFAGSRWANTSEGDKLIRPMIQLSLGGQYAINRWLHVYLEVNDYLNRKDEIFYGFQSQGIHFLAGVKWKF